MRHKMKVKLRTKAVAMIIILAITLSSIALLISYRIYADTMDAHYRAMAARLTQTTALALDSKLVELYTRAVSRLYLAHPKQEFQEAEAEEYYAPYRQMTNGAEYQKLAQMLEQIKQTNEVLSLYIIYVDAASASCVYVVDADNSETGCPAGTWDVIYEQNYDIFTSPEKGFPAYITNTEEFGWLCSAGAAIYNEKGEVIAYAMTDISMDRVMKERQEFLVHLLMFLAGATVILLLVMIVLIDRSVVSPINRLAEAARSLVDDMQKGEGTQSNSSLSRLRMKSGDEIEALFHSIQFMEKELNSYIQNLFQVTAEKERIGTELDVARHIQASMLPCIFPAFPEQKEIDIYATMDPAKEVGGDFYDFFMVDEEHLAVVMADVSGKGVPAALFMVIGKTLVKDHTQPGCDLGEVFTKVNKLLCDSNSEGMFITAFEGVLDLVTGEFCFVNAGHEMPFLCRKGETYEPYKIPAGFVLAGLEEVRYQAGRMQLSPGDKIFQYTDGVTEAANQADELYGMERLKDILGQNADKSPMELLPAVKEDIDRFVGEAKQFDDITMLCLEYVRRRPERTPKDAISHRKGRKTLYERINLKRRHSKYHGGQ